MPTTKHLHIEGKIKPLGNGRLHFVSADWRDDRSPLVWLIYVLDGQKRQRTGIRLDLDKKVIIDQIGDEKLDREIKSQEQAIWNVVVTERRRQYANSFALDI